MANSDKSSVTSAVSLPKDVDKARKSEAIHSLILKLPYRFDAKASNEDDTESLRKFHRYLLTESAFPTGNSLTELRKT